MFAIKQSKIRIAAPLLIVMAALALSALAPIRANGYVRTNRLFSGGTVVQSSYTLPATGRQGVLVSASAANAEIRLADTLCGPFRMSFTPFSQPSGTRNYSSLSFVFLSDGAEALTLTVENVNDTWSKAYLTRNGERLGRETGLKLPFTDANQTAAEVYVDPVSGDAGAGGHSFDADISGLLDGDYEVKLVFGGIKGASSVVVYAINGQNLTGAYIDDDTAPVLSYAPVAVNAIVGRPYTLPAVTSYDVADKRASALTVTVTGPTGTRKAEGATYTPTAVGSYTITMTAEDSEGNRVTERQSFVAREAFDSTIETSAPSEVTVGRGGSVVFSAATATYGMLRTGRPAVKLTVDGRTFDASMSNTVRFDRTGAFDAVYSIDAAGATAERHVRVNVSDIPVVDVTLDEEYARGTTLTLPDAQAVKDRQTYPTTRRLHTPTGVVTAETVALTTAGDYRLTYSFEYNGDTYVTERTFTVRTAARTLIAERDGIAEPYYGSSPFYGVAANGIVLDAISNSSSFTYDSVIDFNGMTRNAAPLVEFMMMPETQYERDISSIEFTFTDADDPTNSIRLFIRDDGNAGYEYLCNSYAAAGENALIGNFWNVFNTTTGRGCQPRMSFRGVGYEGKLLETSKVFFEYGDLSFWGNYQNGSLVNILTLSNPAHVGAGNEWYGFVNGRAKMSARIIGKGSLLLVSVAGQTLGAPLAVSADNARLVINEKATVGEAGTAFPVFDAYVESSLDGVTYEYDVAAYFNYGEPTQSEIPVMNGAFVPAQSGAYTLVYTASAGGKTIVETANVTVTDSVSRPTITFTPEEEAVFNGGVRLGRSVALPVGTTTGSGLGEMRVTAEGGTIDGGRLTPAKAGAIKVIYTVADYLGRTAREERTVVATAYDGFLFAETATLLNNGLVLHGTTYRLPELTAYKYAADGSRTEGKSRVSATYNGRAITVSSTGEFTPEVENSGDEVTVTYMPEGGGEPFVYRLTVIKTDGLSYRYFYGEDLTFDAGTDYTRLTAADGTDVRFVNPLPAFDLGLNFVIPSDSKLTGVTLTLTDSVDAAESVSFGLGKTDAGTSAFYVNGKATRGSKTMFAGSQWRLSFDAKSNRILNGNMPLAGMNETLTGARFDGFASDKIFLTITFAAAGKGTLEIRTLCNQSVSNSRGDYAAPSVRIADLPRNAQHGETYTVPALSAADVLDPKVTATVSVRSPGRTMVLDGADAFSEQSFTLTEYGRYTIIFSVKDASGNEGGRSVAVTVCDDVAPQLTVNGTVPENAQVGTELRLPSATATDNVDGTLPVLVYLTDTDGLTYKIEGAFTPQKSGAYRVTYFAEDSFYNYAKQTFTIRV